MPHSNFKYKYYFIKAPTSLITDLASLCCAISLIALVLITSTNKDGVVSDEPAVVMWRQLVEPPCNEIYVVGEGETLHTISDKCGDPCIVERNPHIHDPDDVFPGLVIKIVPLISSNLKRQ